jgi:hypothetical protein
VGKVTKILPTKQAVSAFCLQVNGDFRYPLWQGLFLAGLRYIVGLLAFDAYSFRL